MKILCFEVIAVSYEDVKLIIGMIPLFDGVRLIQVCEGELKDEEGYIICYGFNVRISIYTEKYPEVLINAFGFEEVEDEA